MEKEDLNRVKAKDERYKEWLVIVGKWADKHDITVRQAISVLFKDRLTCKQEGVSQEKHVFQWYEADEFAGVHWHEAKDFTELYFSENKEEIFVKQDIDYALVVGKILDLVSDRFEYGGEDTREGYDTLMTGVDKEAIKILKEWVVEKLKYND